MCIRPPNLGHIGTVETWTKMLKQKNIKVILVFFEFFWLLGNKNVKVRHGMLHIVDWVNLVTKTVFWNKKSWKSHFWEFFGVLGKSVVKIHFKKGRFGQLKRALSTKRCYYKKCHIWNILSAKFGYRASFSILSFTCIFIKNNVLKLKIIQKVQNDI